jgi:hypothetical protein
MTRRILFFLIPALLMGCHDSSSNPGNSTPTNRISTSGQYQISGGVMNPGPRSLKKGEKVSNALKENFDNHGAPFTVLLVRHGPEGKTSELLNVGADGHLMNPNKDYLLRDGDELVLPGASTRHSGTAQ